MSMPREIRLFVFSTVLPALLGLAAAGWAVRELWRKGVDDELRGLETRAMLVADALMGRILAAGYEGDHPVAFPLDRGGRPHPPPPRDLKERHRSSLTPDDIAPLCGGLPGTDGPDGVAFEIRGLDGERFYASPDWPANPGPAGECSLGPPLGDKYLRAARPDGGAGFRRRNGGLAAFLGAAALLLAGAFVSGGVLLVRMIRRERLDARGKADFFDNVSHELKTPLAGIRLNAELLVCGRIPDEAQRRGAMEAILVESDRLGRMVEELLLFGRLGKGTHRYRLETFDLAAFALDPAERQGVAGISQGRAQVRAVGPGAAVVADKDALRQICAALLSNADKYAEGTVEIEIEGPEIRWMDRGPGVAPGDEERIFERYWRGDDSLSAAAPGSGLGLAIARALARGMGGELSYRHRPGGGSVFVLSLQRAQEPPA
jgi:signal transduction histidine kinase